jgi:hypothetical protein
MSDCFHRFRIVWSDKIVVLYTAHDELSDYFYEVSGTNSSTQYPTDELLLSNKAIVPHCSYGSRFSV